MTVADDEDKANTGEEERVLLEERELLEDAGYTIAPLRRLQLEITAGTWIILCLVLVAVVLTIVRWL
jgi:predicted anti-sigma-YlaC factor YlaD